MKSPRMAPRPEHVWLLIAAAAVLLATVLGLSYVVRKHQWATDTLEAVGPRAARLSGLLQNGEQLATEQAALKANLTEYAYPADRVSDEVGNAALQRVRELATARGLRVASSQVTAPKEDKGFDQVGLQLRLEGEWASMVALMSELSAVRPVVFVDTAQLSVQGVGDVARPHNVALQLGLFVLRQRS